MSEPIDPYWTKQNDTDGDNAEWDIEYGEDENGKYTKFKSKEKDEEGKSKKEHKIYKSDVSDSS